MRGAAAASLVSRLFIVVLVAAAYPAFAGDVADMLLNELGSRYTASDSTVDAAQPSRPAFETLRGNGARAGYVLSHGSVIPGSESVTVAGFRKQRSKDYYIDYAGGSLIFMEPVDQTQAVSVSYRYAENDNGERNLVGLPGLPIATSKNLSLNLTYAYRTANRDTGQAIADLATYGFNATTKLGVGSSIKSMFFISSPQTSGKVINHLAPDNDGQTEQQKAKDDKLIIQEGDFSLGSLKLKMGYQNVGENFGGFASLQETDQNLTEILPQLAKEKGLKRLDLEAALDLGSGMGLNMTSNQVKDKTDDIINRSLGFTSNWLKANYSSSMVGKEFGRFKDIKEENRAQLAKETGIKRTSFGLEFASPGAAEDSTWNKLASNVITDESGRIESRAASMNYGGLSIDYSHRAIDSDFSRLNSLSNDDITQMALDIRRQFDSGADASQVNDKDRKQILSESGMERTNLGMSFDGGSLKTGLRMLSISDGKGTIERRTANLSGKNFSLSFMDQTIEQSFERLGDMGDVEKGQFAGERGLHRTGMDGMLKLGTGGLALGFSKVSSTDGASLIRQSFGLTGKGFDLKANFLDIDPEFDRINDLADQDKGLLQQERGFKRMDLTANIKLSDRIDINSFYYMSKNATADLSREQLRNQLSYTTGFGARISMFRDQFTSTAADGASSGYLHQWIKLDHSFNILGGLAFNGLHDTTEKMNADGKTITATIDQAHIETDKKKRTWAAADRKMIDFGNGKIENTESYNLITRLSKALSLTGSLTNIDRGEDGSEETRAYGVQWALSSRLNFNADVMDKDGAKNGVTAKRIYGLSGILTDRFMMFSNVKVAASRLVEDKKGKLFKETNALKMETEVFKGNLVAEYSSSVDTKGNNPFSRGLSFTSSQGPNNRLRFNISYKKRDLGEGDPLPIRSYNLDYRLSEGTTLAYNYFSYREKNDGKVEPVGGASIKLATRLRAFNLAADFREERNFKNGIDRDIYGLCISGKLASGALVEIGYALDDLTNGSGQTKGHTYRAKYDHQISPDQFLTLTSELRTVETCDGRQKELQARIDFHSMFN